MAIKHSSATARLSTKKLKVLRLKLDSVDEARPTDLSIDIVGSDATKTHRVKFGRVTVSNTPPDIDTVTANINAGRLALKRATAVLTNPGVKLDLGADVPRFSVDATRPGLLVRELDGVTESGRIIDGAFVPLG